MTYNFARITLLSRHFRKRKRRLYQKEPGQIKWNQIKMITPQLYKYIGNLK